MKLYDLLLPLQDIRKEHESCHIYCKHWCCEYSGLIKHIPYSFLEQNVEYWSYSFTDKLIVKILCKGDKK